ncbi:UNVERIFIED_CONTAM: hypothetical protein Sangu_2936600 [Sesamum angustifolium]|uniref:Reverse transcriptase Ty1/copia-type domain-containing protein n=1 Tax=Sesamum angustifolium TaxID=2727405 RepID=A0AAW2IKH0_9LAMI
MKKELLALEQKQTWEVVPLADGKQAIGCKWVFTVKLKDDGSLDRYKVQLVAKGYSQVEGVDYTERFSLVATVVIVKAYLDSLFTIKDLRTPRYFLGLHIACLDLGTSITQSKYIHDVISDCGLLQANFAATPLPQGVQLHSSTDAFLDDPEPYCRLVGRLLYLGSLALTFLMECSNSINFCRNLVRFIVGLLFASHFGVLVPAPIPLHCDNQAVLLIMGNPVFMIEQSIWTLIVTLSMNCYKDSFIVSVSTRNKDQLADLFTKTLPGAVFASLACKLTLLVGASSPTCGGNVGTVTWDPG